MKYVEGFYFKLTATILLLDFSKNKQESKQKTSIMPFNQIKHQNARKQVHNVGIFDSTIFCLVRYMVTIFTAQRLSCNTESICNIAARLQTEKYIVPNWGEKYPRNEPERSFTDHKQTIFYYPSSHQTSLMWYISCHALKYHRISGTISYPTFTISFL